MKKLFNIAGPCLTDRHYILPTLERLPDVQRLIDNGEYFVIHAARQSGKTTLLHQLTESINKKGDYYAVYCSLESVQWLTEP